MNELPAVVGSGIGRLVVTGGGQSVADERRIADAHNVAIARRSQQFRFHCNRQQTQSICKSNQV